MEKKYVDLEGNDVLTVEVPQELKSMRLLAGTELEGNEYFEYLDELRESGATNMYGAGAYLQEEFDLDRPEARKILVEWMETFGERHSLTKQKEGK